MEKRDPARADGSAGTLRFGLMALALVTLGAIVYVFWPVDGTTPTPPPPPPSVPAKSETAETASAPAEPEEGSSPRRVRWLDVEVPPPPASPAELADAAEAVYTQHCFVCHGHEGKGDGPAAGRRDIRPRNFTRGMFKFKSSVPDDMPFDEDLFRTISAGIPAASMPSFGDLTPFERWALVARVKTLSKIDLDGGKSINHFERSPAKTKMDLSAPPPRERIDLTRGAKLYRETVQCAKCHGDGGKGDGPAAPDLVDVFDQPIKPPDLTRGEVEFKAGSKVEDIYRVLATGMAGTPMPSFASLPDQDRWEMACYVTSLYQPIPPGERTFLRVGCTSCHTVGKGKYIGPDLAGVMQRHNKEWLKRWLKDPPTMIATDPEARKLFMNSRCRCRATASPTAKSSG